MKLKGPFPEDQFELPDEIRWAVRKYIDDKWSRLRVAGYEQEPAYVAALIARLDGVAYDGPLGRIEFFGTIVADRGPNSAERKWGADFSITGNLKRGNYGIKKAVLGQAKKGQVEQLRVAEQTHLDEQIQSMLKATSSCVVLETPSEDNQPPAVRIVGPQMRGPI
jgi:hypothetical protein